MAGPSLRLLAVSDIHNNLGCVKKLRKQEKNDFDVIVVAGDIGSDVANNVFSVLGTFSCQIVYVLGNWDLKTSVAADYKTPCHLLRFNTIEVGPFVFTGFSWADQIERSAGSRDRIVDMITSKNIDPRRVVLVTHEMIHIRKRMPNLLLHLFGHVHTFNVVRYPSSTYVNVSALDRKLEVVRTDLKSDMHHLMHANAGNYAVIELLDTGEVAVECRLLERNWAAYRRVTEFGRRPNLPMIPEDATFD